MFTRADKIVHILGYTALLLVVLFAHRYEIYEFYDEQIDTRSDCWKIDGVYSATCYSKRFKYQLRGMAIDFIQKYGDIDVELLPRFDEVACVGSKSFRDPECLVEIELDRQVHRIPFNRDFLKMKANGLPESFGRALEQAERIKVTLMTSEGEQKTYKFSVKDPLKETEGWQSW